MKMAYERFGPLTVDMFEVVAKAYELPVPVFNCRQIKFQTKEDKHGISSGQFSIQRRTGKFLHQGIIWHIEKTALIEYTQVTGQPKGGLKLSIYSNGSGYICVQKRAGDYERIEFNISKQTQEIEWRYVKDQDSRGVLLQFWDLTDPDPFIP
jgi:hypothetical protein